MRGEKGNKLIAAGFAGGILVYVLLICIVNLFHFSYNMNADIASDVLLGKLIWESGKIIPDTWYVANELRVICTPNVAAFFFGLTNNMVLSSGLACCFMTMLILLSILCFARTACMERIESLLMGLLCLAIPTGFVMLELVYMFASYYAVHVVILFLTLSMYMKFLRNNHLTFQCIWGILFSFVLGLQGVRGILVIYGPLFGVEIIRFLFGIYQRKKTDLQEKCISLWVAALLLASYLGTLFPVSVGQGFSRNIRKGIPKLLTEVLPDIGKAIGFNNVGMLGKICLGGLLLLSLCILFDILCRMWKKDVIEPIEWTWLVLCCSPALTSFIVAFTTVESTERYYFVFLFLLPLSAVWVWKKGSVAVKCTVGVISIFFALSNIMHIYVPILKSEEPQITEQYQVVQYLEKNDLPIAYATFENANSMTVLSDGKVNVYPVASVGSMNICKWMTSTEWYCPNMPFKQTTAYIITENEKEVFNSFLAGKEKLITEVNKIGKYYIYISKYNYSNLND